MTTLIKNLAEARRHYAAMSDRLARRRKQPIYNQIDRDFLHSEEQEVLEALTHLWDLQCMNRNAFSFGG